jgi:hypothetical protein
MQPRIDSYQWTRRFSPHVPESRYSRGVWALPTQNPLVPVHQSVFSTCPRILTQSRGPPRIPLYQSIHQSVFPTCPRIHAQLRGVGFAHPESPCTSPFSPYQSVSLTCPRIQAQLRGVGFAHPESPCNSPFSSYQSVSPTCSRIPL